MTTQTTKKKPYAGTYKQYLKRIVERIMQEAMLARDRERKIDLDGYLLEDTWDGIVKIGVDEITKAIKAKP